jgi:beta-lactamase regulating signal transducer with metallopeptidase domain
VSIPATEVALIGADWVITFALLKGTLVALAAVLATILFARANPALRSILWTSCFATLVLAPAAAVAAPRWTAPLVAFPQRLWQGAAEGSSVSLGLGIPLAGWFFGVWLAVALIKLMSVALDVRAAVRISRTAVPVTDTGTLSLVDEARRALRVARPVRLAYTDAVPGPVSLGWLRPTVLLPAGSDAWPADRLKAVLLHEVAHVRRADWPLVIACEFVRAVYWVNPVFGWLINRLRIAQDRACDALSIRLGGIRADDYAHHLVAVARTLRPRPAITAALPLVGDTGLEARVHAVMKPVRSTSAFGLAAAVLLTLFLGVGLAGADLWRCDAVASPAAPHLSSPT